MMVDFCDDMLYRRQRKSFNEIGYFSLKFFLHLRDLLNLLCIYAIFSCLLAAVAINVLNFVQWYINIGKFPILEGSILEYKWTFELSCIEALFFNELTLISWNQQQVRCDRMLAEWKGLEPIGCFFASLPFSFLCDIPLNEIFLDRRCESWEIIFCAFILV